MIGAAFDAQPAIRVASQAFGLVVAIFDRGAFVMFLNPGRDVLDIKGNDFTEAGNVGLQGLNGSSEQILEKSPVKLVELFAEPRTTGQRVLDIESIGFGQVKHERKAQCNGKQRMVDEKGAEVGGGDEPFADADQEGFEGNGFGASRPASWGLLVLPSLDHGPIE